ncbi:MAG: hypothetical protein ABJA66_07160 [Actinomycetota bacterium]
MLKAAADETIEIAFVDQGCLGEAAAGQAPAYGIRLEVVKLAAAKKRFMRRIIERSFGFGGAISAIGKRL